MFVKSVAAHDEDALTLAVEAGRRAITSSRVEPESRDAVWAGTESKPYAVKAIAVVHGAAYRGALGIIACSDVILADKETVFGTDEARLGVVPVWTPI